MYVLSEIEKLQKWIDESNNIVFFGGAGVSTDCGIPDFRSTNGLYNLDYAYPPETILSHTFFYNNPEEFYRFYKNKMLYVNALPSFTHLFLADLEKTGKLKAIITQNIDNLHQKASSQNVLELHGSVYRNHCIFCNKAYDVKEIIKAKSIPYCSCGGMIKPDVVLYEESLDQNTLSSSIKAIENADMLIIGGTSLNVYPAASLINYYPGNKLVLINLDKTSYDNKANLIIHKGLSETFKQIKL